MAEMKRLTLLDAGIIGITVIAVGLLAFSVYGSREGTPQVLIEASGQQWIYSIESDTVVSIPGPLGPTEVTIHQEGVHVSDSTCRNKVCESMKTISRIGQWIICLPNDVFIRIEGIETGEREVDDVAF